MEEQTRDLDERSLVNMFRKEVNKIPLLSREEEYILAKQAQTGNHEAVNKLIESNLRFAMMIAFRYWRPEFSMADIVSMACMGLIKASMTFDPDKGFRFLTYAEPAIRQHIIIGILDHKKHAHDSLNEPIYKEYKEENDNETTLQDLLISEESQADKKYFYNVDVRNLLKHLTAKEREVIELRYWHDKTLEEIELIMRLSPERIRQIEGKALIKLRHAIYGQYKKDGIRCNAKKDYVLT